MTEAVLFPRKGRLADFGPRVKPSEPPAQVSEPRNLHLQVVRLCTRDQIQLNWARVVLEVIRTTCENTGHAGENWHKSFHSGEVHAMVDESAPKISRVGDYVHVGHLERAFRGAALPENALRTVLETVRSLVGVASDPPSNASSCTSFIDRARRLDKLGHTDAALDLLYDAIDECLTAGRFSELASCLRGIQPASLSLDLLLGILTVTLPAKSRLPTREAFKDKVERVLRQRGEWEVGILTGL